MDAIAKPSPAGWRSAAVGELLWHPLRFLRWTGRLRYRPVPHTRFNPVPAASPEVFSGPRPHCIDPTMPWTPSRPGDFVMAHLVTVDHGLATCIGHVFDRQGRLIDGATHKYDPDGDYIRWKSRNARIRSRSRFPRVHYYRETVGILAASTQDFYFHWLMDVLPRLNLLERSGQKVDYFYIAPGLPFQKETLSLLGLSANQIIRTRDIEVLSATKLVVPCHQIMPGRAFPRWVLDFLREKFLPAAPVTASPRRFYISRRAARHRRLENEDQIVQNLRAYGFAEVELEKLSFREQVNLFRNAEAIVAPHGSGLTNLVFCSPGTKIIELFPTANVDLYYRLSHACGLEHHFLKGRGGEPDVLSTLNYVIDWERLKQTLAAAGIPPA